MDDENFFSLPFLSVFEFHVKGISGKCMAVKTGSDTYVVIEREENSGWSSVRCPSGTVNFSKYLNLWELENTIIDHGKASHEIQKLINHRPA